MGRADYTGDTAVRRDLYRVAVGHANRILSVVRCMSRIDHADHARIRHAGCDRRKPSAHNRDSRAQAFATP